MAGPVQELPNVNNSKIGPTESSETDEAGLKSMLYRVVETNKTTASMKGSAAKRRRFTRYRDSPA